MNIDQIKRNLQQNKTGGGSNFNNVGGEPTSKKRSESPEPVRNVVANNLYGGDGKDSDDDTTPNSEVWDVADSGDGVDFDGSVGKFISKFQLADEVYDWRPNTTKGKNSRKNFTDFLVNGI